MYQLRKRYEVKQAANGFIVDVYYEKDDEEYSRLKDEYRELEDRIEKTIFYDSKLPSEFNEVLREFRQFSKKFKPYKQTLIFTNIGETIKFLNTFFDENSVR